jgi:signal transduction histidine kinase
MFTSNHDFALATLLLLFASSISVLFGVFITSSATKVLGDLVNGAEQLGSGDFSTRIAAEGRDEVAMLAQSFNQMVDRLEVADASEKALEEARRNLIAWASHDLRTPLASLRAMIDALAEGVVEDADTTHRYLHQSQIEIERMNRLINDLFELAQLDAGSLELQGESASLSDLISDTLERFSARALNAGIKLEASADPGIDPIWMAPDKIERVLNNLLENALRHTPEGGKVALRAAINRQDVCVTVRDSGHGIPDEDLTRIFDRFYRGEKSRSREGYDGGGSGLGLAIARGIVEAHGGSIWAQNNSPDPGSALYFTLPRQSAA